MRDGQTKGQKQTKESEEHDIGTRKEKQKRSIKRTEEQRRGMARTAKEERKKK